MWYPEVGIETLIGKVLVDVKVDKGRDEIWFYVSETEAYRMYHDQNCCENVYIEDINGDIKDLVGLPITLAEEVDNSEFNKAYEESFKLPEGKEDGYRWDYVNESGNYKPDSYTWTFYKLATIKGYVDIRWFGESNGYYSESVSFVKVENKEE